MRIRNATFDASQASGFIMSHRKVLREFQFDKCHLRSGTWDDALAPLTKISGSEAWKKPEEVMDIPIMLNQVTGRSKMECVQGPMWDDVCRNNRGMQVLRRFGLRTKEFVPEHVKRLLRTARAPWQ
jgi:hypothetical protein